ncbi:phage recombination protein Bet [Basilea psittacipulmonis]|uniref:phage recombination protein Bet n=1 Tax=Basilea psittacipulmonis TaxID=1472345 RepID=UPI000689B83B|nr:phage recombination protein Bet [Basilea psittacipulmonis]
MSTNLALLNSSITKLARAIDFGGDVQPAELVNILKSTAFHTKQAITNEQMIALVAVASQYKLNPFTKEIYAFPTNNSIVPIVGVDGWIKLINSNPQLDGIEFEQDNEKCTCVIYRKDRSHPIRVTEYFDECSRPTDPWKKYPKRMLRHKAMIQAARVAFGFSGIYDEDEGERIKESASTENRIIDITPQKNTISPEQAKELEALIHESQSDKEKLLSYFGISSLGTLPIEKYEELKATLTRRIKSKKATDVEVVPKAPEATTVPSNVDPETGEVIDEEDIPF